MTDRTAGDKNDLKIVGRESWRWIATIALHWSLFFSICLGLGYPTLRRYAPNRTEGLSDSAAYYQIVVGRQFERPPGDVFAGRVLVPYLARPFFWLARLYSATEETSVFFALLVANSIFCASSAVLLVSIASRVVNDSVVALVASLLYLLNFAIANLQLAGLIDSGEAFLLLALTWSLSVGKWWSLPLLGVVGALARETFIPFSAVFTLVWWLAVTHPPGSRFPRLGWALGLILCANLTMIALHLLMHGHTVWPWTVASVMSSSSDLLSGLRRCISDRSFWYIYFWLLPIGIWRLKALPAPWVLASFCTALAALIFGAYHNMEGNVGRPIFSITGPMLSLSGALFLARLSGHAYQSRVVAQVIK